MKSYQSKTQIGLLLVIFLFSMLFQGQNAYSQWWKDTVWTKETDQTLLSNLKFSNTDSIIVGGGLFFDSKTGIEIARVDGSNEVHFYNNDQYFLRVNKENKVIHVFEIKTFSIIDSLESDGVQIGNIDISNDERNVVGTITNGIRSWDLQTKKILKTKYWPNEENLKSIGIGMIKFDCSNQRFIGQFAKSYYNPNDPKNPIHIGYFGVYDIQTLDSINYFENATTFRLSNTCKYLAKKVYQDNGIEIYDFNTKKLIWQIPVNPSSLTGYEFSPDDKYLVTAPTIMIWDIEKKEKVYQYASGSSNNIALSHDGKYIVNSVGGFVVLFLARWGGVSVYESNDSSLTLYPNPTNNTIHLSFENKIPQMLNYIILNEAGQIIKPLLNEFTYPGNIEKTFDVSYLQTGTYFLTITGSDFGLTFKVIIVR